MKKAVYTLTDSIDQYIAEFYSDAGVTTDLGTTATEIEINSTNVVEYVLKMQRYLDDSNCPENGRFLVCPPWFIEKILISGSTGYYQPMGDIVNGTVGKMGGFNIKKSTNVPNAAGSTYRIIGINGSHNHGR